MHILGTGLDGLVGSRVVELNPQYNWQNFSLATGFDLTNAKQVDEQISEAAAKIAGSKADSKFLVHLAAFTNVAAAFEQRGDKSGLAYKVNVEGTKNIARVCQKNKIHLIHISTDYIFDGKKEAPYAEEDNPEPIEWYGQTKLEAEQAVQNNCGQHTILRIAFPYRAQFAAKQDILAKTKQAITDGTIYPQFSDTKITPTFIDDIAQIINQIIKTKTTGLFHTTGSAHVSNYEFAITVAKLFNLQQDVIKPGSLVEFLKTNSGRLYHQYLHLSNNKLTKTFGYHMSTLEEGLAKIVNK